MSGVIYKITNHITGKLYIGKTTRTIEERFSEHIKLSNNSTTYLHRSILKHGINSFSIEIIEEVSQDLLDNRERYWISTLNTLTPLGYNITIGGTGGDTSTSENYIRGMLLRPSNKGCLNPNFGKRGESSPNFGSTRTPQQRENIRRGVLNSWRNNSERRRLQSERQTNLNKLGNRKKPYTSIKIRFNGQIYHSLTDAARHTKKSPQYIKKHGDIINE